MTIRWLHAELVMIYLRPLDHGVNVILFTSDVVSLSVDAVGELKLDGIPYSFSSNFLCFPLLCLRVR